MQPDIDSWRERVESFYAAHATAKPPRGWGSGTDAVVGSGLAREVAHGSQSVDEARRFQAELFDAGLAWLTGPKDLGGEDLSPDHVDVFREVARRFDTPDTSPFMIGQRVVAPAILAFGDEAQRRQYVRGFWRGELIGCQLFSEPDAGSDLASLRCRARRDGDGWRVDGQKVWSSGAHHADVGELLARTSDDLSLRHKGLTMFLVDMQSPGITVRPLRQINGNAHFNEVFLENVYVPDSGLLGPVGEGWRVANASLSSERDLDPLDAKLFIDPMNRLIELVHQQGAGADPRVRQALAAAYTRTRIGEWLPGALEHSPAAPIAASIIKLFESTSITEIGQIAGTVLGPAAVADDGAWGHYCWADVMLGAFSQHIAGGTDEIQHNIIGERGLGLPREPRN